MEKSSDIVLATAELDMNVDIASYVDGLDVYLDPFGLERPDGADDQHQDDQQREHRAEEVELVNVVGDVLGVQIIQEEVVIHEVEPGRRWVIQRYGYGQGGQEATVTDASVVLGYLDPDNFLGGSSRLDRGAAERACARLGERLGVDELTAAEGVYRVINTQMAEGVRLQGPGSVCRRTHRILVLT